MPRPSNAPAGLNAKHVERATPYDPSLDPITVDGDATRDFLDLFRSRWNCAILHVLRPRLAQAPPQLRRHQLDGQLPGALEKSVSNALDTLVGAGLVERALPATGRGTLYSLTPDGVKMLPVLHQIDAVCGDCKSLLRRARKRSETARCRRARRQKRAKR